MCEYECDSATQCRSFTIDGLIDVANPNDHKSKPIFIHGVGELFNQMVDIVYHDQFPVNRSIVKTNEFGSKNPRDGSFMNLYQ